MKSLAAPEQAKVMGVSLFRLWTRGVISWEDAVLPGRIRSLAEVAAIKRLSIKAMVKAGVRPDIARAAFDATRAPEHQHAEAHRRRLIERIHAAGIAHDLVARHIGEALASRVVAAPGASHAIGAGAVISAGTLIDAAAMRRRHADELAALIGSAGALAAAAAAMRRRKKRREEEGGENWEPIDEP